MYSGNLTIRPVCAKLTYDTEWFARMDPYAKITIGSSVFKTRTAVNQGKNPNWQDTFNHRVNGESSMHVVLFDKDYVTRDDYIGEATIPLNEVYMKGTHSGWYNVQRKGRSAGQIMIQFEFHSQGGNMGMGMNGMGMGMMNGMNNCGMGMNNGMGMMNGMNNMGMNGMNNGMGMNGMMNNGMNGMGMNGMSSKKMNKMMAMNNLANGNMGMNGMNGMNGMGMMGNMGMGMNGMGNMNMPPNFF